MHTLEYCTHLLMVQGRGHFKIPGTLIGFPFVAHVSGCCKIACQKDKQTLRKQGNKFAHINNLHKEKKDWYFSKNWKLLILQCNPPKSIRFFNYADQKVCNPIHTSLQHHVVTNFIDRIEKGAIAL